MKKLAVLFPGIGYHCDKPLLYYSKKCLSAYGYEIIEVNYKHFPHMKDKDELVKREFDSCLQFFTNQIAQNVDYINAFEFFYCQIRENKCTNMG